MKRWLYLFFALLPCLAACESELLPTATPTHALSGPTIEASATVNPLPFPSDVSGDNYFEGYYDPTAAALPVNAQLPPLAISTQAAGQHFQEISLTTPDGTTLYGDLYAQENRVPGILLLTLNRLDWGDFPDRLYIAGFTVLVMDIRIGAGTGDFQVMIDALSSGTADPGRLVVIGAAEGADLALVGCAGDMICDAVGLISPLGRNTLVNLMAIYNPRPILLAASRDDTDAYTTALAISTVATGEVQFQEFDNAGSGAIILQNRPDFIDLVIQWLRLQFAPAD